MAANTSLSKVLDRVNLVVYQTRIVSPIRDTGEGQKDGSRIKKVLQRCFDPVVLRPLTKKKQEAYRHCRNYGTYVATLNAWAVPIERTEMLIEKLGAIATDWVALAEDLATEITAKVDAYAHDNASEAAAIRQLAPSASDVRNSTRFIYTTFRLRAEDIDDSGCLESDLAGLAGQTLHEFAVALRDASLDKGTGNQYTQSVKDVLGRVATKAKSLSFLHPVLEEVATVLGDLIVQLPSHGTITNASAILVKTVVDNLLQPRQLMRNGFPKVQQAPETVVQAVPATKATKATNDAKAVPTADPQAVTGPPAAIPSMAFCI